MPKSDQEQLDDLRDLKRRISPKLMPLESVSGVGISGGKLAVYLVSEADAKELEKIRKVIAGEAPGIEVTFVTTGVLRPH